MTIVHRQDPTYHALTVPLCAERVQDETIVPPGLVAKDPDEATCQECLALESERALDDEKPFGHLDRTAGADLDRMAAMLGMSRVPAGTTQDRCTLHPETDVALRMRLCVALTAR